jgi:hypothetical protein
MSLPSPWTPSFLDAMRGCGDPLADRTVIAIFEDHGIGRVNRLLRDLVDAGLDALPVDDLKPAARAGIDHYLEVSGRLPEWADAAKIAAGEALFRRYGMMGFSVLACASLPELYTTGRGGTPVLAATQELEAHVYRRLAETSQMVVDVMQAGGLRPCGKGVRAAQKVRLMHGAIRVLIETDPAEQPAAAPRTLGDALESRRWDPSWGVPISAEYLGGTLMTFSYVVLRSMRMMDLNLETAQEEAYLHAWNVTGHVLGVREEFLLGVHTMADAEALFSPFLARNRSRTEEEAEPGRLLTAALLRYLEGRIAAVMPFGVSGILGHVPRVLMHQLLGAETAALLGVPHSTEDVVAEVLAQVGERLVSPFTETASHLHLLAEVLFRLTAEEATAAPAGEPKRPFDIPVQLADGWGLSGYHAPA